MTATDTPITDRIARILDETEPDLHCAQCRVTLRPCRQHQAIAVVDAMRAGELVVLTPETADEILAHDRAETRRIVAEEIADALLAAGRDPHQNLAWMYPEQAADIARKHREVPNG